MTPERITCPSCRANFTVRRHKKLRLAIAGAAALIGGAATDGFIGGAMVGALAYGLATAIDEYRAHRCPECQSISFPVVLPEPIREPEPAAAPTQH